MMQLTFIYNFKYWVRTFHFLVNSLSRHFIQLISYDLFLSLVFMSSVVKNIVTQNVILLLLMITILKFNIYTHCIHNMITCNPDWIPDNTSNTDFEGIIFVPVILRVPTVFFIILQYQAQLHGCITNTDRIHCSGERSHNVSPLCYHINCS